MPPPDAAQEHYRTLQRLQVILIAAARRAWARMNPEFDRSWMALAPGLVTVTAAAQLAAARAATEYVPAVLEEQRTPLAPLVRVRPEAFAGRASDGRSLAGLLFGAVIATKTGVARGLDGGDALAQGQRWLESALRTVVTDAARDTLQAEVVARPRAQWVRVINPPCCTRCAVLAGSIYNWNASFDRHVNCFPAGVVVSGPGHEAAARRWYQGELVVLTTASGQQLPLTGNHPVLTRRGWIPANLLYEGDEVVRSADPEGACSLMVPDHHEVPARVEDVWSALGVAGFDRVPTTPEDFHGDGQYGHVDVVRTYSALGSRLLPEAFGQQVPEVELSTGVSFAESLFVQGAAQLLDFGHAAHASSAVRGLGLGLPFGLAHLGSTYATGFAGAPSGHPSGQHAFRQRTSRDSVLAGQGVLAGSGLVSRDDFVHRDHGTAKWDAPGLSFSMETREGYARVGLDLLDRLAAQVEFDRLVDVRRVEWSGHVYSLASVEGWHCANSLIVSNCDCMALPTTLGNADKYLLNSPRQLVEAGQITDLTKGQRQRLDDGADLSRVLNESRDRWRERMAADRRAAGPVDRLGRSRPEGWAGGGSNPPPVGTTIHQLMDQLTSQVDAARAMQAAGLAR